MASFGYAECWWFVWTVYTTVGFGDWTPVTPFGRIMAVRRTLPCDASAESQRAGVQQRCRTHADRVAHQQVGISCAPKCPWRAAVLSAFHPVVIAACACSFQAPKPKKNFLKKCSTASSCASSGKRQWCSFGTGALFLSPTSLRDSSSQSGIRIGGSACPRCKCCEGVIDGYNSKWSALLAFFCVSLQLKVRRQGHPRHCTRKTICFKKS
jgi:hypothetical protein